MMFQFHRKGQETFLQAQLLACHNSPNWRLAWCPDLLMWTIIVTLVGSRIKLLQSSVRLIMTGHFLLQQNNTDTL